MRHGNRHPDKFHNSAPPRNGSGYRGSYYGADGYDSATVSHRGRGPKGYVRSDARLREIICEHLTDDPNIDASDITVEVRDQNVRLTGSIENRELQQEVEALIERIGGVKEIDNQLHPRMPQPRTLLTMFDYDLSALDPDATMVDPLPPEPTDARSDDKSPGPPER